MREAFRSSVVLLLLLAATRLAVALPSIREPDPPPPPPYPEQVIKDMARFRALFVGFMKRMEAAQARDERLALCREMEDAGTGTQLEALAGMVRREEVPESEWEFLWGDSADNLVALLERVATSHKAHALSPADQIGAVENVARVGGLHLRSLYVWFAEHAEHHAVRREVSRVLGKLEDAERARARKKP